MLKIGCHLSSSKGFLAMGKEAVKIGANTFQFFTRNPRGGAVKAFDEADITAYVEFAAENSLLPPLAHAPYTLNACSADEGLRRFAIDTMKEDIRRLEYIPGSCYNFHPGSHVKQGAEQGIEYIAEALREVLLPEQKTTVLLETMAGKGSEVGGNFGELREIINSAGHSERLGVCLDTCHVFDAGYDIVNDLNAVLDEFNSVVGLEKLKAIHLNDSMNVLGSHKDRHQKIGEGGIGLDAFERIINAPALRELPFYLETPNDLSGYAAEIRVLKGLYRQQ